MSELVNKEKFEKIYEQNKWSNSTEIWVDKETGVNYIFHRNATAGGMTPLIDKDGKPVISSKYID